MRLTAVVGRRGVWAIIGAAWIITGTLSAFVIHGVIAAFPKYSKKGLRKGFFSHELKLGPEVVKVLQ